MATFTQQVEELVLLKCSLLPDEILEFMFSEERDTDAWNRVVEAQSNNDSSLQSLISTPARFALKVKGRPIWFEVQLPTEYPSCQLELCIGVRGFNISRGQQDHWQNVVKEKLAEISDSECPIYELFSAHLLSLLHEQTGAVEPLELKTPSNPVKERIYHALLTSHHLKSSQKRRLMQQWSSELHLHGFAKVGHPGVMYCWGSKSDVEEFVSKVKDMQWLALRVRFVEELKDIESMPRLRSSWSEVEKVGEVVEEMEKLGRENYVLDLGIGSGGKK
ncbi:hypothetical protein M422DRAFT_785125 [Sphaerobolus stellatus SS14]|uniref:Uncharacterized protein n=1 Tax=Sphaerobolus stellatus (strain SS14) TaxID=990650 RepID=A0A0C9TYB3_SPHS4|nr:hypothetical protein M422DRAFT_785125 [Sphaerobolus stellatus SS14]